MFQAWDNGTLRSDVMESFSLLCAAEAIHVAGDLLSCRAVLHALIHLKLVEDTLINKIDKQNFLHVSKIPYSTITVSNY